MKTQPPFNLPTPDQILNENLNFVFFYFDFNKNIFLMYL